MASQAASALLLLLAVGLATRQASCDISFTIVHFNDVHGRIDPSEAGFQGRCEAEAEEAEDCVGGFAKLATLIAAEREKGDVLVLDAGDEFVGTIWTDTFRGRATASFQNALGVDAMTVGNHEFDFGPLTLATYVEKLEFPVLGANIDASAEPALAGKIGNSTTVEVGGVSVGIVGFSTPDTPVQSSPGENVTFLTDLTAIVQGEIDKLREDGVGIIIGLSHVGLALDLDLIPSLSGMDVLVGGHSHTRLEGEEYPTLVADADGTDVPVVQAFFACQLVGVLNVVFNDEGELLSAEGAPVLLGGDEADTDTFVEDDPEMLDLIAMYREEVDAARTRPIGVTEVFLDGERATVRNGETNLGNLVCDAMVWHAKNGTAFEEQLGNIEVCIQNSGGITGSIPEGDVTFEEVIRVLPFSNVVSILRVSPADIYVALENGVRRWANGTGSPEEFPQVAGIRFVFCDEKSVGEKVVSVEIFGGEEFEAVDRDDDDVRINLVTNNFLAAGGDNYTVLAEAEQLSPLGVPLDFALEQYIAEFSPVSPEVEGRIKHDCGSD